MSEILIQSDPAIMMGKPVVVGTRITVELILEKLAAGETIVSEMDSGISDDVVLSIANKRGAVLVTADKDFGELVFRRQQINAGVLLIRLAGLSLHGKAELAAAAVHDHSTELRGAFSVLAPGMIRVRSQP